MTPQLELNFNQLAHGAAVFDNQDRAGMDVHGVRFTPNR
jgi:hypothetical protein